MIRISKQKGSWNRTPSALNPDKALLRVRSLQWDDLRRFATVARIGNFRGAAHQQCGALNTIRASVDRLERLIGQPLLRRDISGTTLTPEGKRVMEIIDVAESSLIALFT